MHNSPPAPFETQWLFAAYGREKLHPVERLQLKAHSEIAQNTLSSL